MVMARGKGSPWEPPSFAVARAIKSPAITTKATTASEPLNRTRRRGSLIVVMPAPQSKYSSAEVGVGIGRRGWEADTGDGGWESTLCEVGSQTSLFVLTMMSVASLNSCSDG